MGFFRRLSDGSKKLYVRFRKTAAGPVAILSALLLFLVVSVGAQVETSEDITCGGPRICESFVNITFPSSSVRERALSLTGNASAIEQVCTSLTVFLDDSKTPYDIYKADSRFRPDNPARWKEFTNWKMGQSFCFDLDKKYEFKINSSKDITKTVKWSLSGELGSSVNVDPVWIGIPREPVSSSTEIGCKDGICSAFIYSGYVFAQNKNGIWKNITDVLDFSITEDLKINVTRDDGEYAIGSIYFNYLNNNYSLSQFSNIIKIIDSKHGLNLTREKSISSWKYALGLTKIPNGLNYIFIEWNKSGTSIDFDYSDLKASNFTIIKEGNKIIIKDFNNNLKNSSFFDPTIFIGNESAVPRRMNMTWMDSGTPGGNSRDFCKIRNTTGDERCMIWVNYTNVNLTADDTINNATIYLSTSSFTATADIKLTNVSDEPRNAYISNFSDTTVSIPPTGFYSPTPNNNPCSQAGSTGGNSNFNASCNSTTQSTTTVNAAGTWSWDVIHMANSVKGSTEAFLFYFWDYDGGPNVQWRAQDDADATLKPKLYLDWTVFVPNAVPRFDADTNNTYQGTTLQNTNTFPFSAIANISFEINITDAEGETANATFEFGGRNYTSTTNPFVRNNTVGRFWINFTSQPANVSNITIPTFRWIAFDIDNGINSTPYFNLRINKNSTSPYSFSFVNDLPINATVTFNSTLKFDGNSSTLAGGGDVSLKLLRNDTTNTTTSPNKTVTNNSYVDSNLPNIANLQTFRVRGVTAEERIYFVFNFSELNMVTLYNATFAVDVSTGASTHNEVGLWNISDGTALYSNNFTMSWNTQPCGSGSFVFNSRCNSTAILATTTINRTVADTDGKVIAWDVRNEINSVKGTSKIIGFVMGPANFSNTINNINIVNLLSTTVATAQPRLILNYSGLVDMQTTSITILLGAGSHNIILYSNEGQNYSASSNTSLYGFVNAGTLNLRTFIDNLPRNKTIDFGTGVTLTANTTDTSNLPTINFYRNNTLIGTGTSVSETSSSISAGAWNLIYNTSGNANWTSSTNNSLWLTVRNISILAQFPSGTTTYQLNISTCVGPGCFQNGTYTPENQTYLTDTSGTPTGWIFNTTNIGEINVDINASTIGIPPACIQIYITNSSSQIRNMTSPVNYFNITNTTQRVRTSLPVNGNQTFWSWTYLLDCQPGTQFDANFNFVSNAS